MYLASHSFTHSNHSLINFVHLDIQTVNGLLAYLCFQHREGSVNERWLGVRAKVLGQNREDLQVLWPSLSTALTPFAVVSRTWQTAGLRGSQLTPYWLCILSQIIYILEL